MCVRESVKNQRTIEAPPLEPLERDNGGKREEKNCILNQNMYRAQAYIQVCL